MGSLGPGSGPRNRPVTRSSRFTNSSQSRRFPGRAVQTFTKMLSKITQEVQCYGKTEFLSPNSQPHTGLLGHCSPLRRLDFISVANQTQISRRSLFHRTQTAGSCSQTPRPIKQVMGLFTERTERYF